MTSSETSSLPGYAMIIAFAAAVAAVASKPIKEAFSTAGAMRWSSPRITAASSTGKSSPPTGTWDIVGREARDGDACGR